ncbi:MAG: sulfide/dihydroorotate dehydrogenase-like FAD/NAD-binding protein [Candidatus Cloacimonetes bacterium]|nr:sulfide/dihydroorotate dehydrogenase-like FAD/NAD-binding protein [Candidatus Cloacimonadota bacterium]MBL7108330.1 sulfide/dihydroorotate dehydrogenase-like FAD/NAD-binding protein [Candidatus Cloacimonadota bacterium]
MFEILSKSEMAAGTIIRFDIKAPKIAKKIKPGQFIILRTSETGERIPITVADVDNLGETIAIIFQVVGKTTALLRSLNVGDFIKDVVGPLGKPAVIENLGTVVVVGGGTGIAILHHITKALKKSGNKIIGIIGAREKDMLILEDEMRLLCDELVVTTDDGSYGKKGFVTDPLKRYISDDDSIKEVYTIGPIIMMKNVCKITEKKKIKTMVSLNPVMVDGTGMCGCCRVSIDNETKFCCVDGPDFEGHKVDFEELEKRNAMYLKDEKESLLFSVK